MGSIANDLPNDILLLIFSALHDDYGSLFRSALVNHAFNRAVSKFLYRRVALAPHSSVLSQRNVDHILANSNITSAALPQYAEYVEIIEVTGYLPPRPPSSEQLSAALSRAIVAFKNLRTMILTPTTFQEDAFTGILRYFASHSDDPTRTTAQAHDTPQALRELVVNTSCTDEERAPILFQLTSLSKLSIYNPTRAILDLLPNWLRRLSDSLTELHLKENCGSITPGVLKSMLPFLAQKIRNISLGLSYSLADEDVFAFLHQLPKLEKVELTYYWQLKPPTSRPSLAQLRSFVVNHTNFQTRGEVRALCKWIRRAIAPSPIQSLYIVQTKTNDIEDDVPSNTGANVSYRSIIDHLCSRHSRTLRILDMKSAYIDVQSLQKLFTCCKELEEVSLCAGSHALTIFRKYGLPLAKLHTASFEIRNTRLSKRRVVDMELVTAIMKHGPPSLQRLSVNGQTWESAWKKTKDGTFALTIHKQPKLAFPWDREPKPVVRHQPEARPPTGSSLMSVTTAATATPLTSAVAAGKKPANQLRVRFG